MINSSNANLSLFSDQTYNLEYSLNDNFSLEDYLKDDDAILCAKKMGPQAQKYFNSEKIEQLIKYVIEEPIYNDQLKGHKYPYVASEILKSDIPFILKKFILSEEEYYNEYKDIFDKIDKNKNGFISYKNLFDVFSQIDKNLEEEEILQMVKENDLDNDGFLNYTEFCRMVKNK